MESIDTSIREEQPDVKAQAAHIEREELSNVTSAFKPVLTLPDGAELPIPKIPAIKVIELMEDAATVDDRTVDMNDRLRAHARLMRTFTDLMNDDRLLQLDIEDFGRVFADFFVHIHRRMARAAGGHPSPPPR